jgi:hypothetical protein
VQCFPTANEKKVKKRKKSVESDSDDDESSNEATAATVQLGSCVDEPPLPGGYTGFCAGFYAPGSHPDDAEIIRRRQLAETWVAINAALGRDVGCRQAENRWYHSLKTSPAGKEAVLQKVEKKVEKKAAKKTPLGKLSSVDALERYHQECAPLSASGTSAFDTCI